MGHATGAVIPTADAPWRSDLESPADGDNGMSDDTDREASASQRLARLTGLLYLAVAVFGMFAGTVSTNLVVPGDAGATADKVLGSLGLVRGSLAAWIIVLAADVAVAVTLFILLRPASATLSLVAAAFRVMYAAIQSSNLLNLFSALALLTGTTSGAVGAGQSNALALVSLDAFGTGFRLGLVFFGLHLVALGWLLVASGYVPRAIGVLVVASGIAYATSSLAQLFLPGDSAAASAALLAFAAIGELALTAWLLVKGIKIHEGAASGTTSSARVAGATGGAR